MKEQLLLQDRLIERELDRLYKELLYASFTKLPENSPRFRCTEGNIYKHLTSLRGIIVYDPTKVFILRPSVLQSIENGENLKQVKKPFFSSLFQRFLVWFKGLFKNQKDFSKDNYRK